MKRTGKCVKCECDQLWVVEKVTQLDAHTRTGTVPMVVTSQEITEVKSDPDVKQNPRSRTVVSRVEAGSFQAMICAECGYTEWYAYNFERLKEIPGARLVGDDQGDAGPYR